MLYPAVLESPSESLPLQRSANPYANSRVLDVHRWSEYPEAKQATDEVFECYRSNFGGQRIHETKLKKHIRNILCDLAYNLYEDPERYVAYSRNKNDYLQDSRYNALHIKYALTVHVMDFLEREGYITSKSGFRDLETGVSYLSRVRPTESFHDLLRFHNLGLSMIERHPDTETILLRGPAQTGRKPLLPYEDSRQTTSWRQQITEYNELLSSSQLQIFGRDLPRQHVHRVFSNGSWDQNGRFYGGCWELFSKDKRNEITVNGSRLIELDYSGLHIALLYAKKGIRYTEDPYSIPGYGPEYRKLFKQIMLTVINASSFEEARRAIQVKVNKDRSGKYPKGVKIKPLLESFCQRHEPIREYFFTGIGVFLQRTDATFTEHVLSHFVRTGTLVLPVHDSFMVASSHEQELLSVMEDTYRRETGFLPDPRIG